MKTNPLISSFTQVNEKLRLSLVISSLLMLSNMVAAQMPGYPAATSPDLLSAAISQKNEQPPVLPSSASSQWYQQATSYLTEREYFFQPFEPGLYSAANHAQHLGFLLSPAGYTVKNFSENSTAEEIWEQKFTVVNIGKAGNLSALPVLKSKTYSEKYLSFEYNHFSIEYTNKDKGMRQNFIIHQQPAGNGKLQVVVHLSGDLSPVIENNDQLLLYSKNDTKALKLAYDKLKVWDANNKLLTASMKLGTNSKLIISVDDADAVYPVTIDPLNHTPAWTANGQGLLFPLLNDLSAHVLYGFSVSSAGDVNGDGYADLLIGVPAYVRIISIAGNTFNPAALGAAFIYYGSPAGASATPNEVLQPSLVTGALAGFSVSAAGDVNGDGKADVIVGAPGDEINLTVILSTTVSTGKVYVYSGASFDGNINTVSAPAAGLSFSQPDFGILALIPANPLFGYSISSAGDVNGDGFADIIVGSPAYFDLLSLTLGGRVDIYHGSASGISTTPNRTIKGGLLNGLFGFSVSTAGRVNNDTYSDVIVGAPASIGILGVGAAFVFHGSAGGITATTAAGANTTLQAPGLLSRTLFGYSVADAGDVNGDGLGDVIAGEPLSLETTLALQVVAVGKAHIFYGSNSGVLTAGSTPLTSPRSPNLLGLIQGNLLYGFSVAGAGDMNCDGLDDVLVGEPGGSAISLGTGALGLVSANAISGNVYAYAGKITTGPVNTPLMTMQETSAISVANLLGASVKSAGDINGDGHPDIIVGAPNGTLNLASSLTGIIGNALGYLTTNSVGSAYVWTGCTFTLLPVELLSFEGREHQDAALLNWTVTGSENKARFEVEKSTNGQSFSKIGVIPASQTTGHQQQYSFTDYMLLTQNNYYRLKIVNADGKSSYSKTVLIIEDLSVKKNMRVSPNPARDVVQLHFSNMPVGNYTLLLINISGQVTVKKQVSLASSIYESKSIERTASMLAGTYFIRLVNQHNETVSTSKIILN